MSGATLTSPFNKTAVSFCLIIILIFSAVSSFSISAVYAQGSTDIFIKPDGSVEGTTSILRNGDVYILSDDISISGKFRVQKSNIIIDGQGHKISGNDSQGINLNNVLYDEELVNNITIKNVHLAGYGIDTSSSHNNTFCGIYFENCGILVQGSGGGRVVVMYNTFDGVGIFLSYCDAVFIVSKNNLPGDSVIVWISATPLFDENYWSDFEQKYPNASEIEGTGMWNTPYEYYYGTGGSYKDEHPLTDPVSIEELPAELNVPTPTPKPTPTYTAKPTPTPNPTNTPTQPAAPTLTPKQTPTNLPAESTETIYSQTPLPTQNPSPTNSPPNQATPEPSSTDILAIGVKTENYTPLTIIIGLTALVGVLAVIYLKKRRG